MCSKVLATKKIGGDSCRGRYATSPIHTLEHTHIVYRVSAGNTEIVEKVRKIQEY